MAVNPSQILQNYFAQQRGGSNVYGGPPQQMGVFQPTAKPSSGPASNSGRPQPPRRPAPASGGDDPFMDALKKLGESRKAERDRQMIEGGAASLTEGGGNLISQGLGTVLGGAATAAGFLGRGVVAAIDEFADTGVGKALAGSGVSGVLGGGGLILPAFQNQHQESEERANQGFFDKVMDPTYGFGVATVDTGNPWIDNTTGFAGDVLLDPLTYVGGAAAKTAAQTTGRAGREVLSARLAREGLFDQADEAARRGVAYLSDEARQIGGVGRPGIYFGVGESSVRLPGTEGLGRAIEKGFANARVNTVSRVAGPLSERLRAVPELKVAQRIMRTGIAENGVAPHQAATRIRFYNQLKTGMKTFTEMRGRELNKFLTSIDEKTARAITHDLERVGANTMDQATEAQAVFQKIRQHMIDAGIDVKDLGENYVPHRWTKAGRKWMTNSADGRAISNYFKLDPMEDPALLKARRFTGGTVIELPSGGKFVVPQSGTIEDINAEIFKQFGIKNALESDVRLLMTGYLQEAGRAIGMRHAFQDLVDGGNIAQALDGIAIEQLDELASITANKKMANLLQKVVADRGKKLGARAAAAAEAVEALRKATVDQLEVAAKGLGSEHASLKKELADLMKAATDVKGDKDVQKAFDALRGRAQMQFDVAVKELDDATESLSALRAEQQLRAQLATPGRQLGSGGAESDLAKAIREAEIAEGRLTDQMDMAMDALERVDELDVALRQAAVDMKTWEEIADSPEHLAQAAVDRFVREETSLVPDLEKVVPENAGPWERRLVDKLKSTVAGEPEEARRQARAAGRHAELARAEATRLQEISGEIERIQASMAALDTEIRSMGQDWVPLHLRSRRAKLLDRLSKSEDSLKDAARKERLAVQRQERRRAAATKPAVASTPQAQADYLPGQVVKGKRQTAFGTANTRTPVPKTRAAASKDFVEAEADRWLQEGRAAGETGDMVRREGSGFYGDETAVEFEGHNLDVAGTARNFRARMDAAQRLSATEERYYELGTIKMELEADLRDIDEDYVDVLGKGKGVKDFSEARAAKQQELLEVQRALVETEKAIEETAGASTEALRSRLANLDKMLQGAQSEAANVGQSRRWHEHLAAHPLREATVWDEKAGKFAGGVSPEMIREQIRLVHKIEATDRIHYRLKGMLEEVSTVKNAPKTEVELADELTSLMDQIEALPEVRYSEVLAAATLKESREVTNEEADVIANYLKMLSDAQKKADADLKSIQNELARDWPTVNQNRTRPGGKVPTKSVTDAGVEIGPQTLSKSEYDMLAQDATPVVASRRSGHMQRGLAQVEADELGGQSAIDDFASELRGDRGSGLGLSDETVDSADAVVLNGRGDAFDALDWEDQADALGENFADPRLAKLLDDLEVAKEARLATRNQYKNALQAYGLDQSAGDGFAYGRWGNVILVDTSGDARWSTARAISLTDKELYDEAKKQGVLPRGGAGRKPKHAELAAALGWKARLYKPGSARYDKLPAGLVESVGRTSAKDQIRKMPPAARRAVLSDARQAERAMFEPIQAQRRLLEEQVRDTTQRLMEVRTVRQEAFDEAQRFADEAARLQADIDRARRVADGVGLREQDAVNARRAADRLQRDAGVAKVQAAGEGQRLSQEAAEASVRVQDAENRIEALAAVEQALGKREADELTALSVERATASLKQGPVQNQMWTAKARADRVKKLAAKVPKKAKNTKGQTPAVINKRLRDVKSVLDDAANEGTRESIATAELLERATQASLAMDSEIAFQAGLKDARSRAQRAVRVLKDPDATDAQKLAAAENSPAGALMKLAHEGISTLEHRVFPEGADFGVKTELRRMLDAFDTSLFRNQPDWVDYWDEANQFFKTWATTSPGFHLRNYISSSFMNLTEGVSFQTSLDAREKWRAYVRAAKAEETSPGSLQKWFDSQGQDVQDAFRATFGSGAGGHFEAEELGELTGPLVRAHLGWLKSNKLTKFSKHWGADRVEGPVRLALAMHYGRRGGDIYSMQRAIARVHFDYSEVSDFDRAMKKFIPFWTWMSRNLPLQMEQMWTKPKAYSIYNNFRKNFDEGEPGEGMPEWMKHVGGFTVARDVPWLNGGADAVLTPDMPHLELDDMLNPQRYGSSLSPFAKVPLELTTNHSFFYEGELFNKDRGEGTAGDIAEYVLKNTIPAYGQGMRLSGQGSYEGKGVEKALNYAGIPIRSVTDEQRKRALERAAGG